MSAVRPVVEKHRGVWVGWSGACGLPRARVRDLLAREEDLDLEPVLLTEDERDGYYLGFSNRMLWPFFHDLPGFAEPREGDWSAYRKVNSTFARILQSRGSGPIWVHDYHLMLVGEELHRLGRPRATVFFLHTPFPEPGTLRALPGRADLVRALARFDCIGFQTERDRRNFLDTYSALEGRVPERPPVETPAEPPGTPLESRTGVFPIAIDALSWSRRSSAPETARRAAAIRRVLPTDSLLLGVDRLDYTKGLPSKLRGYARALARHPSLRGRVTFRQLAVPTREEIPAYARLHRKVQALVDEVNRRFGTTDWTPVDYIRGRWDDDELVAQYRAADVALVTPLRDGMNLVAKEYCASKASGAGVLVLSRFAGSASQLGTGALLVDPWDEDAVAEAIYQAVAMSPMEKQGRMADLRRALRRDDVQAWAGDLLGAFRETVDPRIPPRPPSATRPGRSRSLRADRPAPGLSPRRPSPPVRDS